VATAASGDSVYNINGFEIALGLALGWAVHVDPIKPSSKPPGTKRLKLNCDEMLSKFAFNFDLRRYTSAAAAWRRRGR
jgi:hypothetical protein